MKSLEERIAALELEVFGEVPEEFEYPIYKQSLATGNIFEFTELKTAKCIKLGRNNRYISLGQVMTLLPHTNTKYWEDCEKLGFVYPIYKRAKHSGNVFEFTKLNTAKCIKLGAGSRGWTVGEVDSCMFPHSDSSRWEDCAKPLELEDIQDGAKVIREGETFRIEKILGGFNLRTKKAQYVLISPVCGEVFLEFLDKDGYERGYV